MLEHWIVPKHGIKYIMEKPCFYLFKETGFIDACISSSVRPLVSGTSFATNRTVKPHMLANMKNVPGKRKTM